MRRTEKKLQGRIRRRPCACTVAMMNPSFPIRAAGENSDRLLTMAGKGDRDAFGQLFAAESGRLIAIASRLLRRRELAEEAVQEGFVSAWRNAPSFDAARGSARAWLTTIVRNRALNMLRDGSRTDLMPSEAVVEKRDASGEAVTAWRSLREGDALKNCLDRLEEQRRTSILLAYVGGYSHGEIATQMNAPVGTVKAWIRRGVIALQECLS